MTGGTFLGFVTLESSLVGTVLTRTTAFAPTNASSSPTYRIYGSSGTPVLTGTVDGYRDTGTVGSTTNATPVVVTDVAHGLKTGNRITLAATGIGALNTTFTITRLTDDTFELDGSTAPGSTSSTGTWNVSGLYYFSIACTAANGFAAGTTYSILFNYTVSTAMGERHTFTVV